MKEQNVNAAGFSEHKEPKKDGMFGNLEETILDMYEILQEIRNELMLRKDDGK